MENKIRFDTKTDKIWGQLLVLSSELIQFNCLGKNLNEMKTVPGDILFKGNYERKRLSLVGENDPILDQTAGVNVLHKYFAFLDAVAML